MASESKDGKPALSRKLSMKRKLPIVKQTKTSIYRMVKANPMFLFDEEKTEDLGLRDVKFPPSVTSFADLQSSNMPELNVVKIEPFKKHIEHKKCEKALTKSNTNGNSMNGVIKQSKCKQTNACKTKGDTKKKIENKQKMPVRRSLSAEDFKRHVHFKVEKMSNVENHVSAENIPERLFLEQNVSPIREEKRFLTFKTPTAYHRRSVTVCTPSSLRNSLGIAYTSTPGPQYTSTDLQRRLNNWLSKRGKSLGSYHHLKCFDMQNHDDLENKENIEAVVNLSKNGSYENLGIIIEEDECKDSKDKQLIKQNLPDYGLICKDALSDLHKLIQDGYPHEQCERWLDKIRQKYTYLDEEPQYWECRACLEQSKGNIASAVECYKTAIVKGAEVQAVDESLDQLLQKFSLLNISTNSNDESNEKRAKIILDARNVFKSSIIKFAIQQKKMKRHDEPKIFTVTPVRRSARLSGIGVNNQRLRESLKEIKNDEENIKFENNRFLAMRFIPN